MVSSQAAYAFAALVTTSQHARIPLFVFGVSIAEPSAAFKEQGLEGVVAKRKDSLYQAGRRTGAWSKYRANRGQEFVIGGYVPGTHGLDSIIVGYYNHDDLIYVARVRNGFVPASRRQVFEKLRNLVTSGCPFVNLPETHRSRWGEGFPRTTLSCETSSSNCVGSSIGE